MKSSLSQVTFGVPQGSILHLVLFNLYVCNMQDSVSTTTTVLRYAMQTILCSMVMEKSTNYKTVPT